MPGQLTESGSSSFSLNGIAVMTPRQITRGVALRRYAYGKPIQQIADEAGLPYKHVLAVLKGEPMHIDVAARLTGWLRTPTSRMQRVHDRQDGDVMTGTRVYLLRRLARMRALSGHIKVPLHLRRVENLASFSDGELRAYIYNVEDLVRGRILELYPVIAEHWKFADDMEPWEVIERIDRLKNDPQARHTLLAHQRKVEEKAARQATRAA